MDKDSVVRVAVQWAAEVDPTDRRMDTAMIAMLSLRMSKKLSSEEPPKLLLTSLAYQNCLKRFQEKKNYQRGTSRLDTRDFKHCARLGLFTFMSDTLDCSSFFLNEGSVSRMLTTSRR